MSRVSETQQPRGKSRASPHGTAVALLQVAHTTVATPERTSHPHATQLRVGAGPYPFTLRHPALTGEVDVSFPYPGAGRFRPGCPGRLLRRPVHALDSDRGREGPRHAARPRGAR